MITIQNQNFGVEIELTGLTRSKAASVISNYFGDTMIQHRHDVYDTYSVSDRKGRTWKCSRDSSIRAEYIRGRESTADLRCEVITPILQYEDMEDLQSIIRRLSIAGAFANSSCGIHVHVDGKNHNAESLTRLVNFAVARQDLFYEALNIGDRANRWCKKINSDLLKAMKADSEKSSASMERIWYSSCNDGYCGGIDHQHYNSTRYHGINLHAFFTKGTVEFRLFNGTTHAGKVKAYIQFCLAMSAWAINAKGNLHFMSAAKRETKAERRTLMHSVLVKRLGMRGDEFKTARLHLLSAFEEREAAAEREAI